MTSLRQIEANRRNAEKSTGPITQKGKQRSRCNAISHGLTAETVIGSLEDAEDYKAFEAGIIADYDAQSTMERELVLRLASILWRLRRAAIMETGLFGIQADRLREVRPVEQPRPAPSNICEAAWGKGAVVAVDRCEPFQGPPEAPEAGVGSRPRSEKPAVNTAADFAVCFLRLANLPTHPLDRLSRYESTLWRQVSRILFALDTLDRRKVQERRRSFFGDNWHRAAASPRGRMNSDFEPEA